jgi:hypothetical protein
MSAAQPDVPAEIENYLIGLSARAGQIGAAIGSAVTAPIAGAGVSSKAGARSGARAAARLTTKVEQRSGAAPGTAEQVSARLAAAFPRATALPAGDHIRLAVPAGRTGLQQVVLDVEVGPPGESQVPVVLRGFGKEGLISRKPTKTVTDQAWAAILSAGR